MALQSKGFETIEAENGRAGMKLATVYVPDLILTDIKMEGFDGFATLVAVRYHPLTRTIPVILMTGHANDEGWRLGMELGADGYVTKPFTIAGLIGTIRVQLKKHQSVRQEAMERMEIEIKSSSDEGESANDHHSEEPTEVSNSWFTERSDIQNGAKKYDVVESVDNLQNVETLVDVYLRMLNRFHSNLGNTAMRTAALCCELAKLSAISSEDAQNLRWAGTLHDISLVGLDREAVGRWIRDPFKVTEEESIFIRKHPTDSEQMLKDLPFFKGAGELIRFHHEQWDGSGYPDGLMREMVPWPARLLTAAICYCSQHTLGAPAVRILKSKSGKTLDPQAVELVEMAAQAGKLPKGIREVLLNELRAKHVVAKDIYNGNGMALIRKGRELTDPLIRKVMTINRVTPLEQNILVYC